MHVCIWQLLVSHMLFVDVCIFLWRFSVTALLVRSFVRCLVQQLLVHCVVRSQAFVIVHSSFVHLSFVLCICASTTFNKTNTTRDTQHKQRETTERHRNETRRKETQITQTKKTQTNNTPNTEKRRQEINDQTTCVCVCLSLVCHVWLCPRQCEYWIWIVYCVV